MARARESQPGGGADEIAQQHRQDRKRERDVDWQTLQTVKCWRGSIRRHRLALLSG